MPSVSKAQQRFMGLVHAYKKGEVPASKVSKAVKDAAKSMKKKSTKDFAKTKHKGLPNKLRSENMNEDGHTDVASAKRKLKTSVEDIKDIYSKLKGMSDEESLPSWWTDKITLSSNYLDKARDYITNPNESVSEGSFKTTLRPQKKDINKMKVRFKSDPRRVYTLKRVETGRVGGTSYMFVAPGNRKEYFTPKTWDLANKKGWLSLESVSEAPITSPSQLPYSSPEAQKMAEKDIIGMSKILGKASQMSIKKMMDGVKAKKYDAFDLQRAIMSGPIRDTHTGERDFMRVLWNKVRSGFRRYSKRGKLR